MWFRILQCLNAILLRYSPWLKCLLHPVKLAAPRHPSSTSGDLTISAKPSWIQQAEQGYCSAYSLDNIYIYIHTHIHTHTHIYIYTHIYIHTPNSYTYICMHAMSLQSCPTFCYSMDRSPPGSSVHEILQARILEWVVMPFSRGSSQGWNLHLLCIDRQVLYH